MARHCFCWVLLRRICPVLGTRPLHTWRRIIIQPMDLQLGLICRIWNRAEDKHQSRHPFRLLVRVSRHITIPCQYLVIAVCGQLMMRVLDFDTMALESSVYQGRAFRKAYRRHRPLTLPIQIPFLDFQSQIGDTSSLLIWFS